MVDQGSVKLDPSWLAVLGSEFDQPYMQQLRQFLQQQKSAGKVIYPPGSQWFAAFNSTPFDQVRVGVVSCCLVWRGHAQRTDRGLSRRGGRSNATTREE